MEYQMLSWILIGVISGLVIGLTGAGGAIISLPLFLQLVKIPLLEATTFSLLSVHTSAIFNALPQKKSIEWKTSLTIALFALLSSAIMAPLKPEVPEIAIKTLFLSVILFSLVQLWRKRKVEKAHSEPETWMRVVSGLGLGVIATLTGLGGGVLLVPWLVGVMGFTMNRAVATCLVTIAIASAGSFTFQAIANFDRIQWNWIGLGLLVFGTIVSALVTKELLKRLPDSWLQVLRKAILTAVILFTASSLLLSF